MEWRGKSVGAKLKIIKVKRIAKEGKRIDLLYAGSELSKYDARSIQFASYL